MRAGNNILNRCQTHLLTVRLVLISRKLISGINSCALYCRDCFVQLMKKKTRTFAKVVHSMSCETRLNSHKEHFPKSINGFLIFWAKPKFFEILSTFECAHDKCS